MNECLHGAFDCHFHTAPDVTERKLTDLELAKDWLSAGMSGGVIKSHYSDTTGRAAMLRELYPELSVFGGLVLNRQAGGLNPEAARRMAEAGGRYLWFPTMDSREYRKHHGGEAAKDPGLISLLDEDGELLPAVYEVLDVAAKHDLVVGTGHVGEREGLPLVRAAAERGVKRIVLTHAENLSTYFSPEAQRECVKLGAMVEHSFFTVYHNRITWEQMTEQIRAVGPAHCFLVTDFGQMNSPGSAEGMGLFVKGLLERGFTEGEIMRMVKENPRELFA